jgi:hypothetical protein
VECHEIWNAGAKLHAFPDDICLVSEPGCLIMYGQRSEKNCWAPTRRSAWLRNTRHPSSCFVNAIVFFFSLLRGVQQQKKNP